MRWGDFLNKELKSTIFKAVGLGTGVTTLVLSIMGTIEAKSAVILLSVGLICLSINELENKKAR